MSSSSRPRADRRAALVATALAAVCLAQWLGGPRAQAAGRLASLAVLPAAADGEVALVADVQPVAGAPIPSASFSVLAGDERLPTRAERVLSDQLAVGLIVDGSLAGAQTLQA